MSQATPCTEIPVYDLVGVGFGPSNLALAIAVTEHNGQTGDAPVTALFLERQPSFGWHRGMLLADATMQVSFLKDLVTLRNPTSEYSYLCYLRDRDRLIDFVNHKSFFPLRVEFHDYLEWAAAKVPDMVRYAHEVDQVVPVLRDGVVAAFDVRVRHAGGVSTYRARNLVVATGLRPRIPAGVDACDRIWHSRDLLTNIGRLDGADPARFVVVGAGQSAAEVTAFLHDRFPRAEVCGVFSRYGYSPADDSSFANRIFDPAAVDDYYGAPPEIKKMLMNYHSNTNYAVVDHDLIDELYRRAYREKVAGVQRLRLLNVSRLAAAKETEDGRVEVTIETLTTGELSTITADVLICATGYQPVDPFPLLGEAARHYRRDEFGRAVVERDYRIAADPSVTAGVYLQGGTEHSHGITASLLSNAAVRSGDIVRSIAARLRAGRPLAVAANAG
ncbi:lysine N(6)-hydroxylase/L-ornithine N(5)-oxygenase family protein [Paractinoplanes ferrugineus]|uniref:L-lysine N6-monooxygenase MbtG n=1 Tax=Paractinoplanes ferrugineus TaxID=113564 RepID=A0A919J6Q3_9ACTN|nr:lysine N(6)-hydroxylase/L-ornithine N(5)-oxygenase family protein [Actinoplanes ferrugineus]GIE13629.1 lysine/ornithine N-monooxygenase [Actinoplanes ferrugineus]